MLLELQACFLNPERDKCTAFTYRFSLFCTFASNFLLSFIRTIVPTDQRNRPSPTLYTLLHIYKSNRGVGKAKEMNLHYQALKERRQTPHNRCLPPLLTNVVQCVYSALLLPSLCIRHSSKQFGDMCDTHGHEYSHGFEDAAIVWGLVGKGWLVTNRLVILLLKELPAFINGKTKVRK